MIKRVFLVLTVAFGCQQLSPESVKIPEYPDYVGLMNEQVKRLGNQKAKKEVSLDGKSEIKILTMDSTKWANELAFLKEINPNQPEYIGAFEKSGDDLNQILMLAEGEKGPLKRTSYSRTNDGYEQISATFHEDKDVYIHHREIDIYFENDILNTLKINGYQKMLFKDTVWFRIKVEVN